MSRVTLQRLMDKHHNHLGPNRTGVRDVLNHTLQAPSTPTFQSLNITENPQSRMWLAGM